MPLQTPARPRTPLTPELALPPPFVAVRLRELGVAFAHTISAAKIGDMMWNGEEIDEATMARVVGLFALNFCDPSVVLDKVKGEPVYLILAMTGDKTIRMKPQNLATGLPIRHLEAVG